MSSTTEARTCTIYGCGDVGPIHEDVVDHGPRVRKLLAPADVRFAQCERVYSRNGSLQLNAGSGHSRLDPSMARIFMESGFDIVSMASNHAMDWGPDALQDTVELFETNGVRTVGAGPTLDEACRPVVITSNGVRVAFLAFCSVIREGCAATDTRAGIAPLRVHTYYEPKEYQAGVPPRVVTVPYAEDLDRLLCSIDAARSEADVVVLSMHWGIHFIPRMLADYQRTVAARALERGADVILGHHAHVPKAVEVIEGKVCFHSLSNFVMSAPHATKERIAELSREFGVDHDPNYPRMAYGSDAKRSVIARLEASARGLQSVGFLPALIGTDLCPEILTADDPRFAEAVGYMEWASEDVPHQFSIRDGVVCVA